MLAAAVAFAACPPLAYATDMPGMTLEEQRAQSVYSLQSGYRMFSDREPSRNNLIDSIEDPNSRDSVEVISAIGLLALEDGSTPANKRRILKCFRKSTDGQVRTVAAMRLIELNDAGAQRLGERVLDDGRVELMSKLLLSRVLVDRGNLHGYPYLEDGLRSDISYVKEEALDLKEAFRPHDGKTWNKQGGIVDIAAVDRLTVPSTVIAGH